MLKTLDLFSGIGGFAVGLEATNFFETKCFSSSASANYWETEPQVGRLVDGLSNRVSQLRALGNSIIPQIAEEIGHAIKTAENAQQTT